MAPVTALPSLLDLRPGLHPDLPHEVYHQRRLGVVSKSALVKLHHTPMHYRAWVEQPELEETSDALEFGTAFHMAILEPERFRRSYVVEPEFGDCRFKEAKKRRDEWRAANAGAKHVPADWHRDMLGMAAELRRHPIASKLLRLGEHEVSAAWRDTETGLLCKIRADALVRKLGTIVDLKTTECASEGSFAKACARHYYHWSDALYRAGVRELGIDVKNFVFIAVEKTPPHAVACYELDQQGVQTGYSSVRRLMERMAECVAKNEWPGYPAGIRTVELPPWAD